MKLWSGRFSKDADTRLDDFNSSIRFDYKLYKHDILGSKAHALMLGDCGIIEKSEASLIIKTLDEILFDLENNSLEFDFKAEDIHMFIEAELTKRIGDTGKRLHTARSRNDQVAVDIRLYLKDEVMSLTSLLKDFIKTICDKASLHTQTIMPGYTHLQRAQPITFGHHLMAYSEMFLRDIDRLHDSFKRLDVMPLGAGALATTTYPIDRFHTMNSLNFSQITQNSIDSVSDRDFIIEIISDISIIMMHLSRFSEEMVLWCSLEFKFIELDDAFSTGSSIMPQKKNPDIAELVRGKTGRVYGDLMSILTVMKGLPLSYNKDTQEDKEAIFDALETVKICLSTFMPMLETCKVLEGNMKKSAQTGFINATDCADFLTKNGLPFRESYKITGEIVAYCIAHNFTLESLPLEIYKNFSTVFSDEIYQAVNIETCTFKRNIIAGPAPDLVKSHIELVLSKL